MNTCQEAKKPPGAKAAPRPAREWWRCRVDFVRTRRGGASLDSWDRRLIPSRPYSVKNQFLLNLFHLLRKRWFARFGTNLRDSAQTCANKCKTLFLSS